MRNLLLRTASGVLFVAVIVAATLWGYLCVAFLFFALCLLTLREFYTLVGQMPDVSPNRLVGLLSGGGLFVLFFQLCLPEGELFSVAIEPAALLILLFLLLFLVEPARVVFAGFKQPFLDWGVTLLGVFYIALPFSLALYLSTMRGMYSWQMLLFPLVLVWSNDTGAYCVGSLFGKHKMMPRISPGKSWEGFAGGVLLAGVVGAILGHFAPMSGSFLWVGAGVVVALASVVGDLVESRLKRSVGLKDSGRFLPGHGGFLDRFDAMLFAVPTAVAYFTVAQFFL